MRSVAIIPLFLLCSCAAFMAPNPVVVPIDSRPQGAIVSYQGHDMGRTPCCVPMHRYDSVVTIRLDGRHPRSVNVGTVGNGGLVFAGLLCFGPLELLFDAFTTSWVSIDGTPVLVDLAPADGAPLPPWGRSPAGPRQWAHDGDPPPIRPQR